ncbi:hypothetical protein Rhe02_54280 [Rhizocola hellebori]|uniref:Uncharacterized protein n=1 Tax=Rhizocola hellebori TaxID=1392758 RepID=A0A8J3VIS4_9ACTN|nr:hypothetical protein [Rhizocola hellebori]GIH07361.1 hypothetical protein Rhe02_54280 [Rhizocola hellebori]
MILAVSGWREWKDAAFIRRHLDEAIGQHFLLGERTVPVTVRVGEQRGADAIVRAHIAGTDGVTPAVYDAGWTPENHHYAGSVRNKRMLLGDDLDDVTAGRMADLLLAFPQPGKVWNGKGSGTWNCITQAHYRGIEVRIPAYRVSDELRGSDQPLLDLAGQVIS